MAFPTYTQLETIIKGHTWDVDSTGDFDCVDVAKKADSLYFPGVGWGTTGIHGNGKDIFANANPKYYQKISNDPKNANQLPKPGDIICFYPTPRAGYTNTFSNPYGHVALFKGSANGQLTILMQSSGTGKAAWLDTHSWKYRPCIGWLRPIAQASPTPPPPTVPKADYDKLSADFTTYKRTMADKIDVLNKQVTILNNQLNDQKAQLAAQGNDTAQLNSLGTLLKWFIARLGLK